MAVRAPASRLARVSTVDHEALSDRDGTTRTGPFAKPICGVDGTPAAAEAARQAMAISGPQSALTLVAVASEAGAALTSHGWLDHREAERAVRRLEAEIARPGALATEVISGLNVAKALAVRAGTGHDLLAAGAGGSARSGSLPGSTSSRLVHDARIPLLLARAPREGIRFPGAIMIAFDGSRDARRAAELGGRIAALQRAPVKIVHVRQELSGRTEQAAALVRAHSVEPTVSVIEGEPAPALLEFAASQDVGLLVLGRRGISGLKLLGGVCEKAAGRAGCSVLLTPAPPEGDDPAQI